MAIENLSQRPVDQFLISGTAVERAELGPIAPGHSVVRHLRFTGDGQMDYSLRQGDQVRQGVLDRSASSTCGGRKVVRISTNGECDVLPLRPFGSD